VTPAVGRFFASEKDPVVVVSYGFWKRALQGRANLEAIALRFANRSFSVIGVMPAGSEFPSGTDIWFPSAAVYPYFESRTAHNFLVIARLRPGVSFEEARAEVASIGGAVKLENGSKVDEVSFSLFPFRERSVRDVRSALVVLCGAVGLLLLIACSNVGNLLLVRATARRKELAVRVALGASRAHLARQFIAESLLLTLLAAALGTLLAFWSVDLIVGLYHANLPHIGEIAVNRNVLFFTLAVAVVVGLILGLLPVLHGSADQLQTDLQQAGRGYSAHRASRRIRDGLVVIQVALTLMLLVGAGLLGRSFQQLLEVDPGFRPDNVISMTVLRSEPEDPSALRALGESNRRLLERIESLPGITNAGGISALPMSGDGANGTFLEVRDGKAPETMQEFVRRLDALPPSERARDADYRAASAGYFTTMGIPLLRGRLFQESDGPEALHVAVVSESLVRRFWPNENPIGKQIEYGNMDGDLHLLNIVGVVGDVRDNAMDRDPRPTVYTDYLQRPGSTSEFSIVVRGRGDAAGLIAAMRREVRELDPEAPVQFETIHQIVSTSLDNRRFSMVMLAVFAGAALLLATVGLYAVLAYVISQRTTEIGIRMALGAQRTDMLQLVLRQGFILLGAGVGAGILLAIGSTRLLRAFLYGIGPTDLLTYTAVILLLAVTALIATFVPARRAMSVDPMIALRYE
jgi:predicted permease